MNQQKKSVVPTGARLLSNSAVKVSHKHRELDSGLQVLWLVAELQGGPSG